MKDIERIGKDEANIVPKHKALLGCGVQMTVEVYYWRRCYGWRVEVVLAHRAHGLDLGFDVVHRLVNRSDVAIMTKHCVLVRLEVVGC